MIKYIFRRAQARLRAAKARTRVINARFDQSMSERKIDRLERYWLRMANIAEGRPPFKQWW